MKRLWRILKIIFSYRLDLLAKPESLPLRFRLLLKLGPWQFYKRSDTPDPQRLREALEALGPIFIKFGQMLSTRRDLLTPEMADELEKLQDDVPPFDSNLAIQIIEEELGDSISNIFSSFDETPLASASIAQVHTATLKDGKDVVVKVVRPDIYSVVKQDVALMKLLSQRLDNSIAELKRLRLPEVVAEYEHVIVGELNLLLEAANTSLLRKNCLGSDLHYVPEVYFDYCTEKVMVSERIYGIPVTDVAALTAQGTNMRELAERGVEIFFTQVFRDSFFHADMHPGNIFVDVSNPEKPKYIGIDCAIIGTLNEFDQYYLARNLIAIFNQQYREVAELHIECGWVGENTSVGEFEATMRMLCEPIFQKPLGEVSFGKILINLFQTARRFDMRIQPSLVLLQKTLLHVEGLGRQLYPQLDLWNTAKPFLENWLKERYSPTGLIHEMRRRSPSLLEQLPKLPELLLEIPKQNEQLIALQQTQQRQLTLLENNVAQSNRQRKTLSIIIFTLFAAMLTAFPEVINIAKALPVSSWLIILVGGIWLLKRR